MSADPPFSPLPTASATFWRTGWQTSQVKPAARLRHRKGNRSSQGLPRVRCSFWMPRWLPKASFPQILRWRTKAKLPMPGAQEIPASRQSAHGADGRVYPQGHSRAEDHGRNPNPVIGETTSCRKEIFLVSHQSEPRFFAGGAVGAKRLLPDNECRNASASDLWREQHDRIRMQAQHLALSGGCGHISSYHFPIRFRSEFSNICEIASFVLPAHIAMSQQIRQLGRSCPLGSSPAAPAIVYHH